MVPRLPHPRQQIARLRDSRLQPFVAQWERLPESVRTPITESARAAAKELRSVRRPRDVRRLLRDPEAVNRVADPLNPALDRIATIVARSTFPISWRTAQAAVTTSSAAGATAASALEVCSVLGIEAPPAAVAVAGMAGAAAVATELVEFYLIAAASMTELRRAGLEDPRLLRRVLITTYVGANLTDAGAERIGASLARRALPSLAPVAGIPAATWTSWRDVRRARTAVHEILRDTNRDRAQMRPPRPAQ